MEGASPLNSLYGMSANLGRPQADEHTIKQKIRRLNFDDAEEFVAPRILEIGVHLFLY